MQSEGEGSDLPIVCSLTADEVAAMRGGLLPGLLAEASGKEAIPGGFRWRFDSRAELVKKAGEVIEAEHGCCRFLRFVLVVEPGDGPMWLEVTGPEGTAEFLSVVVDTPAACAGGGGS